MILVYMKIKIITSYKGGFFRIDDFQSFSYTNKTSSLAVCWFVDDRKVHPKDFRTETNQGKIQLPSTTLINSGFKKKNTQTLPFADRFVSITNRENEHQNKRSFSDN